MSKNPQPDAARFYAAREWLTKHYTNPDKTVDYGGIAGAMINMLASIVLMQARSVQDIEKLLPIITDDLCNVITTNIKSRAASDTAH